MFEVFLLLAFLACGAIITVILFKVVLAIVLLPFKILSGVFHLVVGLAALALGVVVFVLLVPVFVLLLIPVFIVLSILALPLIVLWGLLQLVF